jgi:hypothetical protein
LQQIAAPAVAAVLAPRQAGTGNRQKTLKTVGMERA